MSGTDGRTIATPPKIRLHILKRFAIWEWAIAFSIIFFLVDKCSELHREIDPKAIAFAYIALYLFIITKVSFPKTIAWIELSGEVAFKIKTLVNRRYTDLLFYIIYLFIFNLKYILVFYVIYEFTIPTFLFLGHINSYWPVNKSSVLHAFLSVFTNCLLFTASIIGLQLINFFTRDAILKPVHFVYYLHDKLSKKIDDRQEL